MPEALSLRCVSSSELSSYASVPIAFTVSSILRPMYADDGIGGISLSEEPLAAPYVKDYDVYEKPTDWPTLFDTSRWLFMIASINNQLVGAAAVAWDTPGVFLLRGQRDLACLWDIRVHPDWRNRGIGTALFGKAVAWARTRGCRLLQIETQNINVPACRFYRHLGCTLGTIDQYGYIGTAVEDEVLLLWYLRLK
jgi:GNAT superfamily N-acetyltransferase